MNVHPSSSLLKLRRAFLVAAVLLTGSCGDDAAPGTTPEPPPTEPTPPAAPALLGFSPKSPSTSQAVALNGTAQSGAEVLVYASDDCTGIQLGLAQTADDGSFSLLVAMPQNTETSVSALARVGDGPLSACSEVLTYLHDDTPPEVSLTSVVDAVDVEGTLRVGTTTASLRVSASDAGSGVASVNATTDGQTFEATLLPDGEWGVTVSLGAEGTNDVNISATDEAGVERQVDVQIARDTTPPSCTISPVEAAASMFDSRYWINAPGDLAVSGASDDASAFTVTLEADAGVAGSNTADAIIDGAAGTWSGTVATADGANTITATCVDIFGHEAEDKVFVEVDQVPPQLSIGSSQVTTEFAVSVTVDEAGLPIFEYGDVTTTLFPDDCLSGDPQGQDEMDCSVGHVKVISRMTLADDGHPSDDNLMYFVAQPSDDSGISWQELSVEFQLESDEAVVSAWQTAVYSEIDEGFLAIVAAPFYDVISGSGVASSVPDTVRLRTTDKAGNIAERVIRIQLGLRPPPLIFEPVTEWVTTAWDASSIEMRTFKGLLAVLGQYPSENVPVNNAKGMRIGRYRIRNPHPIPVQTRLEWGSMELEATYQHTYAVLSDGVGQGCGAYCAVDEQCRFTSGGQLAYACGASLPGPSTGIITNDDFLDDSEDPNKKTALATAWATEADLESGALPSPGPVGFEPIEIGPQSSVIVDHLVPAEQEVLQTTEHDGTWYEMIDSGDKLSGWCRSEGFSPLTGPTCFDNPKTVPRVITSLTLTTPSEAKVLMFEGVAALPIDSTENSSPVWRLRYVAMPSSHTWTAPVP